MFVQLKRLGQGGPRLLRPRPVRGLHTGEVVPALGTIRHPLGQFHQRGLEIFRVTQLIEEFRRHQKIGHVDFRLIDALGEHIHPLLILAKLNMRRGKL